MSTKVVEKEFSPLTIRKYTNLQGMGGLPVFVAIISDDDLSDLDDVVHAFARNYVQERGEPRNIQHFRNFAGALTHHLSKIYQKAEGIAILIFPDKTAVSSLWGDFMNHLHCRMELYFLVNTMWHL